MSFSLFASHLLLFLPRCTGFLANEGAIVSHPSTPEPRPQLCDALTKIVSLRVALLPDFTVLLACLMVCAGAWKHIYPLRDPIDEHNQQVDNQPKWLHAIFRAENLNILPAQLIQNSRLCDSHIAGQNGHTHARRSLRHALRKSS